ncbi:hypothetical protein [Mesorhizobium sp.]|uniref:hypothetical protein n=1 Tax=Mesorhizobium sp. TaxID=1871066 RepID=UPI000FEA67E2|nr:hypothetical protein [Mesorhizobium sp.]RWC32342.1 MAG: hypothetical protein EOS27_08060 [Mesorhizobium sp.]TIX22893.1 MAG: hypothetical protein E5V35_24250 [Mesorhizobium sp.]
MDASDDSPRDQLLVENWVAIAGMPKAIFGWPDWQTTSPRQRKIGQEAGESDQLVLSSLLLDDSGATLEGVELRIVVWRDRPLEDATALLQVENDGWMPISRLDCWPYSPHTNRYWRRLHQIPIVDGSHIHRTEDNARLGRKAFTASENLPSAVVVDSEPQSFRDMLRMVEFYFNIDGACDLPPPQWQERLI